ncbi:MAG: CocE/NonD family hydrolase [Gammaproteobacteria bacterium]|nr:CocE/NonD family hydrolase [Gammaproteobacteria bacterium]MYF60560.1 CocE/NonD family hydrolase [Gammaproteobacteria bacterium]
MPELGSPLMNRRDDSTAALPARTAASPARTAASSMLALALLTLTASCGDAPPSGAGVIGPASTLERHQALHIPMRDDVRIAVDVWLPEGIEPGTRLPTMVRATRYWRARGLVDVPLERASNFDEAERWNGAGYALVLIDARGSGASFGIRRFELAEDEVRDYGEVVDWIVAQPWSNRRVGAYGVSYAGNTAEMLAVNRHPAVRAVAPLFNDFDNFGHLVFPGGVLTVGFLESWSNRTRMQDLNDICGLSGVDGPECDELRRNQVTGVKPVDADLDGALLAAAVTEHEANTVPFGAALEYEFRDDPFGRYDETNVGHRRSPSGHLPQIEESGAAMFIRAGWQDAATVNGTLGRYNTISNAQHVFIGPWDHGARNDADPFRPDDTPVVPDAAARFTELVAFFDAHLKEGGSGQTPTEINYYTLGADRWTRTEIWPPEGFDDVTWYFGAEGTLTRDAPSAIDAEDAYTVDFTATTGTRNRWYTNGGGGDVVYGDRREEDAKLLTYTSAPMEVDTEITGHPVVTLHVASTESDGAFIVYLEDVAPDGTVRYVTEGQLRAVMRAVTDDPPLYRKYGPHRSELRADAMPLVPGEVAEISFDLWATSVLIREGHRIRVAIAGADADTFLRYPRDGGVPVLSVQRNASYPSAIVLSMKPIS